MEYFWLCASAIAAGVVNAVVSKYTSPIVALELSPTGLANATSTVVLFPGTAASVWVIGSPACKK